MKFLSYINLNKVEFEKIFKEYFNPLVNFIYRYLNDYEQSREIVQVAFTKLWNNREKLNINTSFKSYIYSTTKNTMIDYIRKNKYHSKSIELDHNLEIEDSCEEEFDTYLVRNIVETSLNKLKPRTKEIFILNKFEGLTYEEIAQYLGVSKRAVEDNMAKTLVFLKEELNNHPELF